MILVILVKLVNLLNLAKLVILYISFSGGSKSVTYKGRETPKQPFKCQIVTKCESVPKQPLVSDCNQM